MFLDLFGYFSLTVVPDGLKLQLSFVLSTSGQQTCADKKIYVLFTGIQTICILFVCLLSHIKWVNPHATKTYDLNQYQLLVVASCHLSLRTYSRSLFARGLSIDSRAYVISQHARWPIRTPLPTCANQDAWVAITPKRPKIEFYSHSHAARLNTKSVFSLIHLPASFICLWPSCHSDLGGSRHGWGLFLEQTEYPQTLVFSLACLSSWKSHVSE